MSPRDVSTHVAHARYDRPPVTTEPSVEPDLDLAPGMVVGEYRIDRKIGRGAFGSVYQASHPVIGKLVAIKTLARKYSVEPEMVNRFVTEARAVNQIRHRNIIDIFSFGTLPDGRAFYVMELLEGETLQARLARVGKLSLAEALPIFRAVARALDAAHAHGIAHRDLKPDNVYLALDADGTQPKLLDFGIAKLLHERDSPHKTETGIAVGTAYYMSPEQCRGKDVDHRTDFYAFGVVAYQVLTGAMPIDAPDYLSLLMRQISVEPAPPSSRVPELPPAVDDAIAWLMRKEPAQRPPDLATAVRALEVGAVTGPPNPRATKLVPPAKRPPRLATKLVVGIASTVIAGLATFVVLDHDDDAPPPSTPAPIAAPSTTPTPRPLTPPPTLTPTIRLQIDGVPADTKAIAFGHAIGSAPGSISLPRGSTAIDVRFEHAGYSATTATIVPDHDAALHVTMPRRPTPASGTPAQKDPNSIENPFNKAQ
jgi:eukaryotic-like serine/threonine-protein kinase